MHCEECRRFHRNETDGKSHYHTQYRKRSSALRPRLEKAPSKLQYRAKLVKTCSEGWNLNKVHPRTSHKGPEEEKRCSSTFSLTSALDGVRDATPRPLYSRERPGTHCIGGWVGPRAGLEGCGKSRPSGIRSPDRPARSESLYRLSYFGPPIKFKYKN